jgi:hypothetical protein
MISRDQRAFNRIQVEVPLQFTMPKTEELAVTRLLNYCQGGIYFESTQPLAPDDETKIVMPDLLAKTPATNTYAGYRVRVRWCNEIKESPEPKFGIGAQLLDKIENLKKAKSLAKNSTCELCDRLIEGESICRIEGTGCLCLPCYKHLEGLPDGPAREVILRYIDRNIL